MDFSQDTIIKRNKEIDATDIDGEKVMMDLEKGQYYMLNSVAGDIWDLIGEKISIKDIVTNLTSEYEVDETECKSSVFEFLGRLKNAGLIEII